MDGCILCIIMTNQYKAIGRQFFSAMAWLRPLETLLWLQYCTSAPLVRGMTHRNWTLCHHILKFYVISAVTWVHTDQMSLTNPGIRYFSKRRQNSLQFCNFIKPFLNVLKIGECIAHMMNYGETQISCLLFYEQEFIFVSKRSVSPYLLTYLFSLFAFVARW